MNNLCTLFQRFLSLGLRLNFKLKTHASAAFDELPRNLELLHYTIYYLHWIERSFVSNVRKF